GEAASRLNADEELVAYRVAQEALTNVVRHAGARRAQVTLRGDGDAGVLEGVDDGRGIDAVSEGSGLRGMRGRTLLVGARLAVEPTPAGGTAVRLVLRP